MRLTAEELLPLVYDELRRLAVHKLALERPGLTLQATALVHEAYLRLTTGTAPLSWKNHGHFMGAFAEAMRRILVEAARRRSTLKRGGPARRLPLSALDVSEHSDEEFLALDDALGRLAGIDPQKAEVVRLRYFAGLTIEETAAALEISPRTVDRAWAYARAWLLTELGDGAAAFDSDS